MVYFSKTFIVYFSVLDHHTLVMSEYSDLSFQNKKKKIHSSGFTEHFDFY